MGMSLPNQMYHVFKSRPLMEEGKIALIHLYQPIIGSDAFALYFTLEGDLQEQTENEFIHLDILNALNIGMARFEEARRKLEGIGLLKVFKKETPEGEAVYLYALQEPVYPQNFFQDELYSFLLLNQLGERKFEQLARRYQPASLNTEGFQEVTVNFMEIYGLNAERFARDEEKLQEVQARFEEPKTKLVLQDEQMDWTFFMHEAKRHYINPQNFTKEFREKLVLYHNLYGYDVLELVEMMTDAVSLTDGMIRQKEFEKNVLKRSQRVVAKSAEKPNYTDDQEIRRFNTLKQTGFSENDVMLIRESENNAPMEFLQAIKVEKKSFVTDSEQWLIRSLVERSPLSSSVINVLMHYVLVVQNNASLTASFTNKIAAEWSELQIKNAEEAIRHVRDLVKKAKERRNAPSRGNAKVIRQEKLPKWAEKPVEEVTLSPERQAEIDQKLQEYLQKKAGDD